MSDQNIPQRLKETSENCLRAFDAWAEDRKNADKRAILGEAVHELRKVASRLEIEMAISERDEQSKKPIPIPNHRAKKRSDGASNGTNGSHAAENNDLPDFIQKDKGGSDSNQQKAKRTIRRKRASSGDE